MKLIVSTPQPVVVVRSGVQGPPGPLVQDLQMTLAIAPVTTIDLSVSKETFDLVVTQNTVLELINGGPRQDGKKLMLRVKRTGAFSVAFGTSFTFGADFDSVPLSPPGLTDVIGFLYHHASGKGMVVAYNLGFTV